MDDYRNDKLHQGEPTPIPPMPDWPKFPKIPEEGKTVEARETTMPPVPPKFPEEAEIPAAPAAPEVPEAPAEMTKETEPPEAPAETADVPVSSEAPAKAPAAPETPDASAAPETPDAPATPETFRRPEPPFRPVQQGQTAPQRPANVGAPYGQPGYPGYTPPYAPTPAQPRYSAPQPQTPGVQPGAYPHYPPYAVPPAGTRAVPEYPQRPEKQPRRRGAWVAVLVAACLALSLGGGFFGARWANPGSTGTPSGVVGENSGFTSDPDDPMVLYKSVVLTDENGDEITGTLTQTQVYEAVHNSVVEITTDFLTSYGNFQYVTSGAGSGVIVTEDGYVVTNNHVITDESTGAFAKAVTVRLADGTDYEASIIGSDEDADIALLKIDATGLSPAVLGDSDTLKVGDQIMAVGNPLGELGGTATGGMVSATDREITVENSEMTLIQIDAAINPGNSGGGLFNMRGELVGIVNAKSTGTDIEGLGFAIPVNDAEHVITELRTNGYVTGKVFVGVVLYDITDPYTAYRYFRSQATGVYVWELTEGYNDDALQPGDRVIAVDGSEITSTADVQAAVKSHSVGDTVTFTVYRGGQMIDVQVTCYEYRPDSVDFGR